MRETPREEGEPVRETPRQAVALGRGATAPL